MTMLVISHDFGVIARLSNRIAVLYAGRIIEQGPARAILGTPQHHYTRLLLSARPKITDSRIDRFVGIPGTPPMGGAVAGCAFASRCPAADERCRLLAPMLVSRGEHSVACWHPGSGQEG
jgi:oligopeptide/dipeptide ABC transporter ATP-binding protein